MGLKGARSMAAFAKSAEKLKSFGRSWTHHVSMPIAGLAAVSGYMAVSFKRQMGLVATDAGGTAKEVERLEKSVLGLARESQFGPQQLAESLFHVESSGYRGAKAMKVLHESQKLATTGNSDLQSTTYALVSATKALYGESTKNIKRTAAEINGIVAHGDVRLEELTESFGSGLLAKAKAMGLSLRDVGAAMDVMTARGIPAQRASYALGFTMQKLIPYGKKAEEAFSSIGLGQETLIKASQNGKYGYVTGLEVLQKHLDRLSKNQQTKVIEEMFGGGRMTSGLLTDLQNLGEMKKIYGELGNEVQIYNRHAREAAEQPKVELEEAWSSVQSSLIEIGDELIPEVVPGIKKIAEYGEKAADVFMKIPGPVKAIGIAALIAVGPLSSMLGYLAGGTGRFLIAANGIAKMGTRFNTSMSEGAGFTGSLGKAFGGSGAAGALTAAKGFATVIGPAVAAAGIGSIVMSATSGEWEKVGFEGGGAMVGGLAAVLTGNPELAPLTAGLGAFAGKFISGLFSSSPKVSTMRRNIEALQESTKNYHESLEALAPANKHAEKSAKHHAEAVEHEHRAEWALAETLAKFGPETRPATRAQIELDEAQRAVIQSARAEKNRNRLAGNALKVFRMETTKHVAQIKQNLPLEDKRIANLNKRLNREPHNLKLAKEALGVERHHAKAKRELIEAYAAAEEKGPKGWVKQLEKMTPEQAKFGTKGKVLVTRVQEQADAFRELKEEGAVVPGLYRKIARAYRQASQELGNFHAETEGIGPARLHDRGAEGRHHPTPQRIHPGNKHKHGSTGAIQARRLSFNKPSGSHINTAPLAQSGAGRDINVTVVSTLDGREVARNTAKVAREESLLQ